MDRDKVRWRFLLAGHAYLPEFAGINGGDALNELIDEEIRRAVRDAERYRFLRSDGRCPFAETDPVWEDCADFDKAVDARMRNGS